MRMLAPGIATHKRRRVVLERVSFLGGCGFDRDHHAFAGRGRAAVSVWNLDFQSSVWRSIRPSRVTSLRASPGNAYNADAIEKTVEDLTILIAKRGYPFAVVRPRGPRGPAQACQSALRTSRCSPVRQLLSEA
jgi:hypothetical protein